MKRLEIVIFIFLYNFTAFSIESDEELKIIKENKTLFSKFTILPYKQNYLLPVTYNSKPNFEPFDIHSKLGNTEAITSVDEVEAKFQISLKFGIAKELVSNNDRLYMAYTQQSYWQVYNSTNSRPFRETNYEPEIFWQKGINFQLGSFKLDLISIGLVHQSNGQSSNLSRSWNRVYTQFTISKGHFLLVFRPWYRVNEKNENDENPDLEDFTGNFELTMAYNQSNFIYSLLHRNNFSTNKQLYIAGLSFPLDHRIKGYVQYVYGYSENLLDYNKLTNKVGIGILFSDFL